MVVLSSGRMYSCSPTILKMFTDFSNGSQFCLVPKLLKGEEICFSKSSESSQQKTSAVYIGRVFIEKYNGVYKIKIHIVSFVIASDSSVGFVKTADLRGATGKYFEPVKGFSVFKGFKELLANRDILRSAKSSHRFDGIGTQEKVQLKVLKNIRINLSA